MSHILSHSALQYLTQSSFPVVTTTPLELVPLGDVPMKLLVPPPESTATAATPLNAPTTLGRTPLVSPPLVTVASLVPPPVVSYHYFVPPPASSTPPATVKVHLTRRAKPVIVTEFRTITLTEFEWSSNELNDTLSMHQPS